MEHLTKKEQAAEKAEAAEAKEHAKAGEKPEMDSLGQENPAWEMERKNIKAANERAEKAEQEEQTPEHKAPKH
jgi:hypothetical protein